ncbi:MAG: penicillin-binding protein 1C [Crocinitomicaceae bacterium]|nr:penicillin-binding protein 1C [Crocinitomicaceae bacterium]MBK8924374.1 penicillin-binding protein 1C [Crocinitomicaceae bacterium]
MRQFISRHRNLLTVLSGTLLLLWLFCLPEKLFEDPTCTVLYDRDGNLLGATIAEDGQWRFPANDTIPYKFKKALLEFEDRNFYSHWGLSVRGMSRALWQNIKGGKKVSGGSTITMQLMRMSRKGQDRNIWQKIVEIWWATRAEWKYSKDELLAMYASNAPMGGNVVGLDAASWRYFARPAYELTWAESATLAVLPNAPSLMHPGKNRDELIAKRNRLLDRLFEIGEMDSMTWELSKLEPLPDEPHPMPAYAPQLMNRAIADGRSGKIIHTTIDLSVQQRVNEIVKFHHEQLRTNQIFNAAVLVMDVNSGEVLAYTGNVPGLETEHGSDVDIISAPRSTGSILKPFLYAGMLESGDLTPSMLVQDIPTVMSGYSPKNYNYKYDGVVAADVALAKSLNVPLVRMLTKYSVPKFQLLLQKLKFSTLTKSPDHYGLSLILGGAEVNLWDLVSAYAMMARTVNQFPDRKQGINRKAYYMQGTADTSDEHAILSAAACYYTFQAMIEVARPEEDINWELFSTSQKIAWKTGTSFGFRDAWAVGVTPKYVVGVWVGNADGEGRPGLIGREVAAPILFDVFSSLPKSDWFDKPYDQMVETEVCSKSGYRAGDYCDQKTMTWLPKTCMNTSACPYHKQIFLDETQMYTVSSDCYDLSKAVKRNWFILPAEAAYYYRNHDPNYIDQPPIMEGCTDEKEMKDLVILYPKKFSSIYVPLNMNEEREKVIMSATHKQKDMMLFWHLDDTFLGTTQHLHEMVLLPSPGKHMLTIIDENGISASVEFTVTNEVE